MIFIYSLRGIRETDNMMAGARAGAERALAARRQLGSEIHG